MLSFVLFRRTALPARNLQANRKDRPAPIVLFGDFTLEMRGYNRPSR